MLLLLFASSDVQGSNCEPSPINGLLSDELVAAQSEYESTMRPRLDPESQARALTWRFDHQAEPLEPKAPSHLEHAIPVLVNCTEAALHVRLEIGTTRDTAYEERERFARLVAGAPFAHGSWYAGATHGTSRNVRSYYGAAIVNTEIRPLAFEARWQSDEGILKTLLSAGVHLFTTETMELALGFVQLDESDAMQRRLMLKFTGEF